MAATRVLIVHDDAAFCDRVRQGLAAVDPATETLTAISGMRALGIAKQQRPDLIIADGDLEGMDGYAFTSELKSDAELGDIPIVIVANQPSEASALKARQVGAAAHMASSVATDEIVQRVTSLMLSGGAPAPVIPPATSPQVAAGGSPPAQVREPQGAPGAPLQIDGPPTEEYGLMQPPPEGYGTTQATTSEPAGYGAPHEAPAGYGAPSVAPSASASTPAADFGSPPPASDLPHVDDLLRLMIDRGGSDLHITVGSAPGIRLRGEIVQVEDAKSLTPKDTQEMLLSLLSEEQRRRFETELELDFAYSIPGLSRFRTNIFQQRNSMGAVFRVIPLRIPTLEDLNLPRVCRFLSERPRGLVLVTGPTGSGKSTTLAAMIDHINATRPVHIITLEDPIEFMHKNKKAYVNQREVGEDTHSFTSALKRVLRQDPDVILVGEMRDLETISAALTAAETGHLVLATLHTTGGPETVDRIIDVFPPHQQQQVRMQLSTTMEGVLSQTLLRSTDGKSRVMAMEIMLGIPAISNLIREGKTHQMATIIQGGASMGMQTLDQHLKALLQAGKITFEEAIQKAKEPRELAQMVGRKI